jgi:hypothetical protein
VQGKSGEGGDQGTALAAWCTVKKKKAPPLPLEATIITNVQMRYEIWGMAVTYYT